ncbi:DNA helicase [Mycena indigotica]|uniref:DNA helicase n=1 Tax=Mycena indigotica TaxID=2126181 RepID=A0A8H6T5F3_9AGAR|nr:DNA helicase [Mycena indigotica]KAF7312118.1 DNA helicase [Mycena indigotica]
MEADELVMHWRVPRSTLPIMSSKRGRKRNDNLPPNRARDVQRAFRARRAAHLLALEQRVSELEEENSCLRQALNLPQANRPPLGKGPTGKDKPKTNDGSQPNAAHQLLLGSSGDSSADSPTSDEEDSVSSSTVPSRATIEEIQNGTGVWGQTIVMQEEVPSYQPVSAPPSMSTKAMAYSPTYSRSSSLTSMYMYSASDRPSYPSPFEQQQQQQPAHRSYQYTTSQPAYEQPREVSSVTVGYPPARRSTSDYSSLSGGYHPSIRLPSPPLQDQHPPVLHSHHSQHDPHAHHRSAYPSDGHIIT